MKLLKPTLLFMYACCIPFLATSQQTISSEDLHKVVGEWTGTLTYMDYSSNNPYTMPANLVIEEGKKEGHFNIFHKYPNEPKANSKGKLTISDDGKRLNGEEVSSIDRQANGDVEIVTMYKGKDDNKTAKIKNVYLFGTEKLIFRKEVKFEDTEKWIMRNEYSYKR